MGYTNSSLVDYVKISPKSSNPRNHTIDTISIHTMAGDCSIETCGQIFQTVDASSNYGIGSDGRIGMYVEEKNRSWCTSNRDNDNRAITIEVASITQSEPYECTKEAMDSLIRLCADICRRNGIKKLIWKGDKSLIGQVEKENMTVHRWFANKSCCGQYLYDEMGNIASKTNALLEGKDTTVKKDAPKYSTVEKKIWNALTKNSIKLTDIAKAALMGHMFAESGLQANNLQNNFEKKLGYTDASYTKAVDNGSYKNFANDSAGYGLIQWTYHTRKENLLKYVKEHDKSIGGITPQVNFLIKELRENKAVLQGIQNAKTVREASDILLTKFICPANQNDAVKKKRAKYGEDYYKRFKGKGILKVGTSSPSDPSYKIEITGSIVNVRNKPSVNSPIVCTVKKGNAFTIVREKTAEGLKWGYLKSGAGWIALKYTKKI